MSNTNDIVTSVLTGNLQEFKQGFSKLLAEKSVDFLGARSTEVSRGLVTECDCGCDADLEEVTNCIQTHTRSKRQSMDINYSSIVQVQASSSHKVHHTRQSEKQRKMQRNLKV